MASKEAFKSLSWTRDQYLVSTDPSLIPIQQLIEIFDSEDIYWAKTLSLSAAQQMIDNSVCFGLYERDQTKQQDQEVPQTTGKLFGFARFVTDFVTYVYLCDVWIDGSRRGEGLGRWLVQCCNETLDTMPDLRKLMLATADWERSVPYYEKLMGVKLIESVKGKSLAILEKKGRGHPTYGQDGSTYN